MIGAAVLESLGIATKSVPQQQSEHAGVPNEKSALEGDASPSCIGSVHSPTYEKEPDATACKASDQSLGEQPSFGTRYVAIQGGQLCGPFIGCLLLTVPR